MNKKVLLVYAGEESKLPRFPLSLLALASYIRKKGYEPVIFDRRIKEIIPNHEIYMCVCISSMTGPDLKSAINISKFFSGDTPVIWGGHHASALPEQTVKEDYIDSVIVGEGEKALITALKDIEKGELKQIYHQDPVDMNELDLPAYDLIDVTKYLDYKDGWSYEIARGCPHRCRFCYVHYFHDKKWRNKSVEKAITEIKFIVDKYKIKKLKIIGDNFFVNKNFALEVCKQITPLKLEWVSTCRADYLAKFTDSEVDIISKSGCKILQIGAESGNQEMLDYMQKDITPEDSWKAILKCHDFNILASVSLMIGLPGETRQQIMDTLDLYDILITHSEIMGVYLYEPFPGTPMYEDAVKMNYKPPKSLEEWSNVQLRTKEMPWHGKMGPELETISKVARFKYFISHIKQFSKENIRRKTGLPYPLIMLGIIPFRISAYIRWKSRFFKLGYEWKWFFRILHSFVEVY